MKKTKHEACMACGGPTEEREETVKHEFAGIPVTLVGVPVIHCLECGEREVGIPAIESLQALLAKQIAEKPARLTPTEIRFLRKSLGLSSVDLAKKMSVDRSTVSRWEAKEGAQDMGEQSEKLLRVLALTEKPVEAYPLEEMASEKVAPLRLSLQHDKRGWRPTAVG